MLRILLCIDSSGPSLRAVDYVIRTADRYKEKPQLYLLNVQPPLPGDVTMFIRHDQVRQFHDEEGRKALAGARAKLDAAKCPYEVSVEVGSAAETIIRYAQEKRCDQIYIGTRGLGQIAGILLGSVTTKVIHLSDIPILLVK